VQVAGVNVWPQRVAEALRAHPDVLDAVVRPMRADEGERLKAFVVPRPDATRRRCAPRSPSSRARACRRPSGPRSRSARGCR
jgi:acyl-CoA synthetase (AMP-forming)/AMP-acid ligase II